MDTLAVTSLTLSHFRSHKLTAIMASQQPVAISGPNGAGKTNILEAVSLLSPGRGIRRAASDDLGRKPENVGWKVSASLISGAQLHEVETWADPDDARQLTIDGKPTPQTALGRIARVLWLTPAMDRLWIEGADGRRRFVDRITLSFDPLHAEASLSYEKAMRNRNRLLREGNTDGYWYEALETQMAEAGSRIRASRQAALEQLSAAQDAAETMFPSARLSLTEPASAPDLSEAFRTSRAADLRAGRTLVGPHRADLEAIYEEKNAPASQCSTGEQKALLVSLILSNARALAQQTNMAPILLLDEVAAHLDPGRRGALYDEIYALGSQAWITATERSLFEGLEGRSQSITVSDTHGVSSVS